MAIKYLSGLSVDSTVLVVDAANDRVGIGTASPAYKLDVAGTISNNSAQNIIYASYDAVAALFQRVGTYGGVIQLGRSGVSNSTTIDYPADGTFAVSTASSERLRITSSGNVGIGTTSPVVKLQVDGTITSTGVLTAYTSVPSINIGHNGDSAFIAATSGGGADTPISFSVGNNNEKMRITSAGNVGIGTTTPLADGLTIRREGGDRKVLLRLDRPNTPGLQTALQFTVSDIMVGQIQHEYAASNLNHMSFTLRSVGGADIIPLWLQNSGNVGIGTTAPGYKLDVSGDINFTNTLKFGGVTVLSNSGADVYANIRVIRNESTALNDGMYIGYNNSGGASGHLRFFANGTNERMRIDASNGNVGIGTTAPNAKLNVRGTEGSGSVNPQEDLMHVGGNELGGVGGYAGIRIGGASNTSYGAYIRGVKTTAYGNYWNTALTFSVTRTNTETTIDEVMRITSGGNVGIGTTAPGALLQVGQASTDTDALIRLSVSYTGSTPRGGIVWHDTANVTGKIHTEYNGTTMTSMVFGSLYNSGYNSNPLMFIRGDGNVGIGTTSPGYKLDVAGTGAFSGNVAINGTFIGTDQTFGGAYRTFAFGVNSNGYNRIFAANDATDGLYLNAATGQGINFRVNGGGANVLVVASTGAATFSSTVTAVNYSSTIANKATLATASGAINVPYTTSNINEFQTIGFSYPSSVDNVTRWGMAMTATNYAAGLADLIFFTAATERLRIDNAGAATFSSSVTASSLIKSGGTSAQYLMADGSVSTLTNPVTGTGTTNYIPKFTGASTIGDSLVYDNGTTVFINATTAPALGSPEFFVKMGTANSYEGILVASSSNNNVIAIAHTGSLGLITTNYGTSGSNTPLAFGTNGAEQMRLDASGNVGIGTTSPSYKLDVESSSGLIETIRVKNGWTGGSDGAQLLLGNSANFTNAYFRLNGGGNSSQAGIGSLNIGLTVSAPMAFYTADTERIRITSAGNVGIGDTDTYGVRMHIAGVGAATSTGTGSSNIVMLLRDTTAGAQNVGAGIAFAGNDGTNTGVTFATINGRKETGTSGDYASYLSFQTRLNGNNLTERMRIASTGATRLNAYGSGSFTGTVAYNLAVDSSGNIIETAGGVVDGSGTANYVTKWIDANTIGNSAIYDDGSNVGIGTTSPSYKLTINSADENHLRLENGSELGIIRVLDSGPLDIWSHGDTANEIFFRQGTGSGTVKMAIDASGNVGIGTTSPAYKLDVNGSLNVAANLYNSIGGNKAFGGNGSTFLYLYTGTTALAILNNADTSELVRITNAGNVGIGTTSPGYSLDVAGTSRSDLHIFRSNQSAPTADAFIFRPADNTVALGTANSERIRVSSSEVWFKIGSSTTGYEASFSNDDNGFNIYASRYGGTGKYLTLNSTGAVENMRLTSNGNVGIGTTAPGVKLEVIGTKQTIVSTDNGVVNITDNSGFAANSGGSLVFRGVYNSAGSTAGTGFIDTLKDNGTDGNYSYAMAFGSRSNGSSSIERMRIASSGNVGIGTTSPGSRLQVTATSNSATTVDNGITILNDSGVNNCLAGIRLSTYGDSDGGLYPKQFIGAIRDGAFGAGKGSIVFCNRDAADTSVVALSDEKMRILPSGNVGIGTTSPSAKLQTVSSGLGDGGGIRITNSGAGGDDYRIWPTATVNGEGAGKLIFTNNGGNVLTLTSAGNVGIGTTSPGSKLEVSGGLAHFAQTATTGSAFRWGSFGTAVSPDTMLCMNQLWNGSGWTILDANYGTTAINLGSAAASPTMQFQTGGANTSATTKMIILNNGDVGIGTTAPTALLTVAGTADLAWSASTSKLQISRSSTVARLQNYENGSASTNLALQWDGGNVGIGTTNPLARLNVWTPSATGQQVGLRLNNPFGFDNLNTGAKIVFSQDRSTAEDIPMGELGVGQGDAATSVNGYMYFSTKGSNTMGERMRITSGGNVGIGTTAPAFTSGDGLEIQRSSATATLRLDSGVFATELRAYTDGTFLGQLSNSYLDLGTDNSTKVRITGAGNVGIGTTSPSSLLNVVASGSAPAALTVQDNARKVKIGRDQIEVTDLSDTAVTMYLQPNANLVINSSAGNVGIGVQPTEKLHVDGSTLITYNNSFQSTNSVGNKAILARVSPTSGIINYAEYATATNLNGFVIGSDDARVKGNIATDSLEFITNTSTRMTVLSSGNVGINTTTPGSTLHVVGDVLIQTGALGVGVNPNATDGRIDASNDIVAFSTSDRRLKENITPIANALEKVRSLTGVEFDWKQETKSVHGYEGHDVGVIAQDVQAVLPEAVRTNDSGYLSVRYEKMIALLVEANKELADRVEQLEKLIK